jgi:hypothetical protein
MLAAITYRLPMTLNHSTRVDETKAPLEQRLTDRTVIFMKASANAHLLRPSLGSIDLASVQIAGFLAYASASLLLTKVAIHAPLQAASSVPTGQPVAPLLLSNIFI